MKVRTLLAVTLATAAPAAAGPEHDHARTPAVTTARPTAPRAATPAPTVAASPRILPTGSPACGNVQAKMLPKRRAEIEACLRAEAARPASPDVAIAARTSPSVAAPRSATGAVSPNVATPGSARVAAAPRTLPNGSPACGNVQAKMPASKRAEIEACQRAEAAKPQVSK